MELGFRKFIADIGQLVKDSVSLASHTAIGEHHRRFNHVQSLMDNGQFKETIQYLEELKKELWAQADSSFRYRLLVNLGVASLGLGENSTAAPQFIEALHYNPEDDVALAYAGMGYTFQEEFDKAEEYIEKALDKNPANAIARAPPLQFPNHGCPLSQQTRADAVCVQAQRSLPP